MTEVYPVEVEESSVFFLRILEYLAIYLSGKVTLRHLLVVCLPQHIDSVILEHLQEHFEFWEFATVVLAPLTWEQHTRTDVF